MRPGRWCVQVASTPARWINFYFFYRARPARPQPKDPHPAPSMHGGLALVCSPRRVRAASSAPRGVCAASRLAETTAQARRGRSAPWSRPRRPRAAAAGPDADRAGHARAEVYRAGSARRSFAADRAARSARGTSYVWLWLRAPRGARAAVRSIHQHMQQYRCICSMFMHEVRGAASWHFRARAGARVKFMHTRCTCCPVPQHVTSC